MVRNQCDYCTWDGLVLGGCPRFDYLLVHPAAASLPHALSTARMHTLTCTITNVPRQKRTRTHTHPSIHPQHQTHPPTHPPIQSSTHSVIHPRHGSVYTTDTPNATSSASVSHALKHCQKLQLKCTHPHPYSRTRHPRPHTRLHHSLIDAPLLPPSAPAHVCITRSLMLLPSPISTRPRLHHSLIDAPAFPHQHPPTSASLAH